MKAVLILALFVGLAVSLPAEKHSTKYTTKYDNVDLDEILKNERLYRKYFNCLANKGRCTPDGKELKAVLPDALASDCAKCSDFQKRGSEKVLRFMLDKKQADYDVLEKLYDTAGVYRNKYSTNN